MNFSERPSSLTRALFVVGTRPEAIKMAPVIKACQQQPEIEPLVCFTGQHREMLSQVASYFEIQPDYDLALMQPNQSLSTLTARCLEGLDDVLTQCRPDCVVAQGDTTTVLCSSMTAFYRRLPFIHIEAGLRTGDIFSPWPEEFNRRMASLSAAIHCAPTERSAENLRSEGVAPASIHVTGNTVIDALLWTRDRERKNDQTWQAKYEMLAHRRMILITGHRRENFGDKFESVCQAITELSQCFEDTEFVFPVHLNPRVREPVFRILGNRPNIHLVEPAIYPEFVWLMDRSTLILTDSGGVQEEAPSLRKPVLVTRDTTERPEAVEAGAVQLVGTRKSTIVRTVERLLTDEQAYASHQIDCNPYGKGDAAARIVELVLSDALKSGKSRQAA